MTIQLTTYSFCSTNVNEKATCSSLLRDKIKLLHPQLNNVYINYSNNHSCITIAGSATTVQNAKADILKLQPIETTLSFHTLYPGLAYRFLARLSLHEQLQSIAIKQNIQIIVDYNDVTIRLIGSADKVELARIDVLLYFDKLLGLTSKSFKLPLHLSNVIAGRRHADVISIMEETGTNIYLPSPWVKITASTPITNAGFESLIHVTGNTDDDIQRAITLLKKLLNQKIKLTCRSQSILNPRKRDWILLNQRNELTKIMKDNGSYISFSNFGSESTNQIEVYAENKTNVERTLRSLNYLTSQIFQVLIYVNFTQPADLITHISHESGAEIIYITELDQLDILGSKEQIQKAIQVICDTSISQEHHKSVIISIELAEDQKEFISGKKNGKINKIMKSCDAIIEFQPFNDYNFIIHIESDDFFKAKDGLDSLRNELPAELSFFVPEICHRRIIGIAGKNIQQVMKQYGVYVKFSSNLELQTFGGYSENEHNVIARTPEKNVQNLQKLKSAVMEFITFQKDRDYVNQVECIPFYSQRLLLHHHGKSLQDKGRLYNSRIAWPERNGSDHVLLTGPQSHIEEMQLCIRRLLPEYLDIHVPASVVLEKLLKSTEIEELHQIIYAKTKIFLILPENLILTKDMINEGDESVKKFSDGVLQVDDSSLKIEGHRFVSPINDFKVTFKLCYDTDSKSHLQKARQMFDKFMEDRFVPLDSNIHRNALNGSPSIDDLRHFAPSVLHHIEHPESYENNAIQAKHQRLEFQNSSIFQFNNNKKSSTGPSSSFSIKAPSVQPPSFEVPSRNNPSIGFNHQMDNNLYKDDSNIWASNAPIDFTTQRSMQLPSNDINFQQPQFSRSSIPKPSNYHFVQPELKPTYSVSLAAHNGNSNYQQYSSASSNDYGNKLPQQQEVQRQNKFTASPHYPMFLPSGYSRQRSVSLIPLDSSNNYSIQPMMENNNMNNSNINVGTPPLPQQLNSNNSKNMVYSNVSRTPRYQSPTFAIHSAPYGYMNNTRFYSFERNNPASSLSTPISVAVNSKTNTDDSKTPYNPATFYMN